MKKIGFITTNKVLAQSLAAMVKTHSRLAFEPFLLLNPPQAALDAELLRLDIAVVDIIEGASNKAQAVQSFCEHIRLAIPGCRVLLLVSPDDTLGHQIAIEATKRKTADDFVFYDTSLDYLFAKLAAF